MKNIYVHGFKVEYEDKAKKGVDYLLYDLDREEARVFFDQARLRKRAEFEDDDEGQYTLYYQGSNSYKLVKR
jgi:hypothetical protein